MMNLLFPVNLKARKVKQLQIRKKDKDKKRESRIYLLEIHFFFLCKTRYIRCIFLTSFFFSALYYFFVNLRNLFFFLFI
jgi:hypothetical protein